MIPFLHRLHAAGSQEENPLWLIVLADMMTNLMLFFLVLYALSQQSPKARAEMARVFDAADVVRSTPLPDEAAQLRFSEESLARKIKELVDDTVVDERVIRIRLKEQLLFPSGQSTLSAAADVPLGKLAVLFKEMPNTVIVEGHSDDVPLKRSPYKSNWELSVARSYSVIERLAREGVPARRLVAAGYGEHHPVGANDSPQGRARNRRVEILVQRGKDTRDE